MARAKAVKAQRRGREAAKAPDAPKENRTDLGDNLRRIRTGLGLTLAEVSKRTKLAHSSLWKVENHQMSLTYAKIVQLARGLGVEVSALFSSVTPTLAPGRRAVTRRGEGSVQETAQGAYVYPCTDLEDRQMTPMIVEVRERNLSKFGPCSRHDGEEFVFVVRGPVIFASEFYRPLELQTGDSIYYDSSMGHAFLRAGPRPAQILCVCGNARADQPASVVALKLSA